MTTTYGYGYSYGLSYGQCQTPIIPPIPPQGVTMTTLNNIVNVSITRETRTIQRASFSIPCFIAEHTIFAERAKEYTSLADILSAGFATTSAVYKAATLYFGQTVAPSKIIVGRRLVPSVTITPTVADTTVYSFKANGTLITFTSDGTATAAEIVTGLKAALTTALIPTNGASGIVATGSNTLILTPSGDASSIANYTANLVAANAASAEDWVSATIPAVRAVKDQWYMLSIDTHVDATVLAVAAYIEGIKATSPKFYVFSSAASDIKTSATTDIFSLVKALSYTHTAYIYSGMATSFAECGLVGRFAPEQAGSNIWEQKTIVGLTVDTLTPDEISYIHGKNGATYENVGSVDVVIGGKCADGGWIDESIFVDWLKSRIQESVYALLVNTRKIGYTSAGAAAIEGSMRSVMAEGIQVGGLADDPAPVVIVPNVLNLSSAQRATRTLPDVTFTARLAGAIRATTISGTVFA
jgi:hypothetical protein